MCRDKCDTLQHTATHCNTLQHAATTHCNTLQHAATHHNVLPFVETSATQCNTLQYTATHRNTLQHTATRCNTLQHTAPNYNVLPCVETSAHELSAECPRTVRRVHCHANMQDAMQHAPSSCLFVISFSCDYIILSFEISWFHFILWWCESILWISPCHDIIGHDVILKFDVILKYYLLKFDDFIWSCDYIKQSGDRRCIGFENLFKIKAS